VSPDAAVVELVGGFVAVVVALALAAVLLRPLWLPLWHLFRGTQQFLEDWNGEPDRPGVQGRPGAMARLAQLERNSGSSLRDAVDRIEAQLAEVQDSARQATTAAGLAVNEAKVNRAVLQETQHNTRRNVNELRGAIGALASTVEQRDREALAKEVGYVRALRRLGINLTDVTEELPDHPAEGDVT
jgi:hypothetical protein